MRQVRLTLVVLAVAATWSLFTPGVWAADEAEALIKQGIEARKTGDHEAALRLFQRSYEMNQGGRALAQMGFAEQALGRWVGAERHLNEALVLFPTDPWIKKNGKVLETALNVIRDHIGSVEIVVAGAESSKPDADLTVDAQAIDRSLWRTTALRLAQGQAVLRIDAPGYESQTRNIAVTAERTLHEVFTLKPQAGRPPRVATEPGPATAASPAPVAPKTADISVAPEPAANPTAVVAPEPRASSIPGRRIAAVITGGAGLVAVAGGIYFGLKVKSDSDDVTKALQFPKATEDSALRAQTLELVFLGAGVAAIVAGSVLYLWPDAGASERRARLTPVLTPGFAGAVLRLPL
jgi:hypothetical protein